MAEFASGNGNGKTIQLNPTTVGAGVLLAIVGVYASGLVTEQRDLRREFAAQQVVIGAEKVRVDALAIESAKIAAVLDRIEENTSAISARLITMEVADKYRLQLEAKARR